MRVYFDLVNTTRALRILGLDVKKNEGHISEPIKDRILRRQSRWNAGLYPMIATTTGEAKSEGAKP